MLRCGLFYIAKTNCKVNIRSIMGVVSVMSVISVVFVEKIYQMVVRMYGSVLSVVSFMTVARVRMLSV